MYYSINITEVQCEGTTEFEMKKTTDTLACSNVPSVEKRSTFCDDENFSSSVKA